MEGGAAFKEKRIKNGSPAEQPRKNFSGTRKWMGNNFVARRL